MDPVFFCFDELHKLAGSVQKGKGLKRVGQLITGSRERALVEKLEGLKRAGQRRSRHISGLVRDTSADELGHVAGVLERRATNLGGNTMSRMRMQRAIRGEMDSVNKARTALGLGAAATGAAGIGVAAHKGSKLPEGPMAKKAALLLPAVLALSLPPEIQRLQRPQVGGTTKLAGYSNFRMPSASIAKG